MRPLPLLALLLIATARAAALYDSCPKPMRLVSGNCVYAAGNALALDCHSLLDKFGDMRCDESQDKLCRYWAVDQCELIKKECAQLRRTHGTKRLPPTCKNLVFTILDPEKRLASDKAFVQSLAEKYASSTAGPTVTQRGGNVSVPADFQECLDSKDPEKQAWRPGAPDVVFSATPRPPKYRIRKIADAFEIETSIHFRYRGMPGNQELVINRVASAVKCVERFFARHKIRLNLGISTPSSGWIGAWSDISDITLIDEKNERSNALEWGILKSEGVRQSDGSVCSLMIHELGHRLGLPDRYKEEGRTDTRPTRNTQAIMRSQMQSSDEAVLTDEDLRILTAPVCGYRKG